MESAKLENEISIMRNILNLDCHYCNSPFQRAATQSYRKGRNSQHHYCSRNCADKAKYETNKRVEIECAQCMTLVIKDGREVKRHKNSFCSSSCAATYNNTHKTTGTRRSKLEVFVENQLKELYPELDMIFNGKKAINSELDIYIPSLNLAFELNGIFHYEPIYGKEKLERIKNNDKRKFQACLEKGIEFCTIDTTSLKYFKEKKASYFLDIISSIISKSYSGVGESRTPVL